MSLIYGLEINNQMPRDPLPIRLIGFVDNSSTQDRKVQKKGYDLLFYFKQDGSFLV